MPENHTPFENGANTPARPLPAVVLDTNASLDWLLFRDAGMHALAAAIEGGALRWLACPAMRDELSHMLRHASLARWQPDADAALARFDRLACMLPAPPLAAPTSAAPLRCTDTDDQVFIELALAHHARWLVSKDGALLKLRRRAALQGLQICRPADWRAAPA